MSTALAIASVTQVIKDLLNNGLIDHNVGASVGEVLVTSLPPDRIATDVGERSQLNLFLYNVTHNAAGRNIGLPARDARGDRAGNPPLALDLHYLLSAYGSRELHQEILLGYGMQLLHENPVLPREAIRRALAPPSPVTGDVGLPPELQRLFESGLGDQVELIKITPLVISTEEISRLWTAFQARYRPTAAYQVTVVLIESRFPARSALPVRARNIYVVTLRQPVIEKVLSQAADGQPEVEGQPILPGYRLVLTGVNLRADDTRVNVGGIEQAPLEATDTRIRVAIPPELRAGVHGVQVIHPQRMGSPPVPHRGFESNAAAFILRPVIDPPSIAVTDVQVAPDGFRSARVSLSLAPPVAARQRVVLLLSEVNPPAGLEPISVSFEALAPGGQSPPVISSPPGFFDTVAFAITGLRPGVYLVRIQVNGAESLLETDASGRFIGPEVTIP